MHAFVPPGAEGLLRGRAHHQRTQVMFDSGAGVAAARFRCRHGRGQVPGPRGSFRSLTVLDLLYPLSQRWSGSGTQAGELGGDRDLDKVSLGSRDPAILSAYLCAGELRAVPELIGRAFGGS